MIVVVHAFALVGAIIGARHNEGSLGWKFGQSKTRSHAGYSRWGGGDGWVHASLMRSWHCL